MQQQLEEKMKDTNHWSGTQFEKLLKQIMYFVIYIIDIYILQPVLFIALFLKVVNDTCQYEIYIIMNEILKSVWLYCNKYNCEEFCHLMTYNVACFVHFGPQNIFTFHFPTPKAFFWARFGVYKSQLLRKSMLIHFL